MKETLENFIIDHWVRTVGEFNRGHMDGFKNIPVDELRERINEIEKGKPVYLICQSGLRSYIASRILEGNGYETYNFSGGFPETSSVYRDLADSEIDSVVQRKQSPHGTHRRWACPCGDFR